LHARGEPGLHRGAEGKARQDDSLGGDLGDGSGEILYLPAPLVVAPLALPDAAEVGPPRFIAELDERPGQRLHDLVVERAAELGMRMRDDGVAALAAFGRIDGAFDSSRRPRDEHAAGGGTHLHAQALDDAAVPQVLLDDLVDVRAVDVGVPDRVRVDHHAGAFFAAIQAPGLVDAHFPGAGKPQLLDPLLGVIAHRGGPLVVAAGAPAVALVAAEKHVPLVVGHARFYPGVSGLRREARNIR